MGKHKNKRLTQEMRQAIIQQYDRQPSWRQQRLAQWLAETFKLNAVPSQPTISLVLRQAGRFMGSSRAGTARPARPKPVRCPELETALNKWLELQIQRDEAVTVHSVRVRAEELLPKVKSKREDFAVSEAWVDFFLRKNFLHCPFSSDSETESGGTVTIAEEKKEVKKQNEAKEAARTPRPSSAKSTGKRKREISSDGRRL